jgi:hypothetical protein
VIKFINVHVFRTQDADRYLGSSLESGANAISFIATQTEATRT